MNYLEFFKIDQQKSASSAKTMLALRVKQAWQRLRQTPVSRHERLALQPLVGLVQGFASSLKTHDFIQFHGLPTSAVLKTGESIDPTLWGDWMLDSQRLRDPLAACLVSQNPFFIQLILPKQTSQTVIEINYLKTKVGRPVYLQIIVPASSHYEFREDDRSPRPPLWIDLCVGPDSHVQYSYNNQQKTPNFQLKRALLAERASVHWQTAVRSRGFNRVTIENYLVGAGAHAQHVGFYEGGVKDQSDLRYASFHLAPRTRSQLEIKGLLRDGAQNNLHGLIHIAPGAAKSEASLNDEALLLGEQARHQAVPALEIETDDVKASHRAATSNINEQHLFYLQSRGLNKQQARELIVTGFLDSVIRRFNDQTFIKLIKTGF